MVSAAGTKRERRPHRKSRTGCQACKQRKIKCDESRPACLNCKRREVECYWPADKSKRNAEEQSRLVSVSAQCRPTTAGFEAASPVHEENSIHGTFRFVPHKKFNDVGPESCMTRVESSDAFQPTTSKHTGEQNLQQLSERIAYLEGTINKPNANHPDPPSTLTYADMALLNHYFHIPDKLPGDDKLLETSFLNPHLLHLILGYSALHWARQEPHQKYELVQQAEKHHDIGMRGATRLLSSAEKELEESVELMINSAVLIGLYHLALGPQPGEYMGFSDHDGRASFLVFIRGVRITRENKEEATQQPSTMPHGTRSVSSSPGFDINVSGGLQLIDSGYTNHLEHLRQLAQSNMNDPLSSASKDASIYLTAIAQLEPYFEAIYPQATFRASELTDEHSRLAFGWLYRASDGFMNRLQEKAPLALAIFACFAVVLKKLETVWFVEGWPEHIMFGVWKFLRPDFRDLIRWPIQELELDGFWTVA
ncbi:hypothetical protein IFR04_005308 [Cadophora malorum]|uniref:Zn(2)-C6 fungal-type domain-containing protein n=1 Tax=Cadophora malorum TaxID=108018 RepID=A0A8H7TMC4_9HELO|nr:hypothetical protein IFR04_005308 [Cadophora malorum]